MTHIRCHAVSIWVNKEVLPVSVSSVVTSEATWQIWLSDITPWDNSPSIILPCRPWISNAAHPYSSTCCFLYRLFHSKLTTVGETTSFHLALFFLSSRSFDMDASSFSSSYVLLSYLKIIFGWREWGGGPCVPTADTAGSAQVGAAGWCQRFKYSHWAELGWAKDYSGWTGGGGLLLGYTCPWLCVSSASLSLYFHKNVALWDLYGKMEDLLNNWLRNILFSDVFLILCFYDSSANSLQQKETTDFTKS